MVRNFPFRLLVLLCLGSFAQDLTAATEYHNARVVIENVGPAAGMRYWYRVNNGSWITAGDSQNQVGETRTLDISNALVDQPGVTAPIEVRVYVSTYNVTPTDNSGNRDASQSIVVYTSMAVTTQNQYTLNTYNQPYGTPPVTCARTITLSNTSLGVQRGYWSLNGTILYAEDILPGASRTHTITPTDCAASYVINAWTVSLFLTPDFELVPRTNVWDTITDTTDSGVSTTNTVSTIYTPPTPIVGSNVVSGAGAPITFTPSASTNLNDAVQQGIAGSVASQQQSDQLSQALLNAIRTNTAALWSPSMDITTMRAQQGTANSYSNSVKGTSFPLTTTVNSVAPTMTVSIAGQTINLNPLANSSIASGLASVRVIMLWFVGVLFLFACVKAVQENLIPMLLAPQATAASSTPALSSISALAMAVAIAVLIGAGVLAVLAGLTALAAYGYATTTPFMTGGVIGNCVWLVNSFFPLPESLAMLLAFWVFKMLCMGGATGVALAVRFLVGSLAILLVTPCNAGEVEIFNGNQDFAFVGGLAIPPGSTAHAFLAGGSYVVDSSNTAATVTLVVESSHTVKHWFSLQSELAGFYEENIDYLEVWWQGFGVAAGCWALGFMFNLVKRVTGPTTD